MDRDKLTEYLQKGEHRWGRVDEDELVYKGRVIEDLQHAREAVLAGDDGWIELVKKGITIPKGSPITFMTRDDFLKVSDSRPENVLRALEMLWVEGDKHPAERIRAFFDSMPAEYEEMNSGKKSHVGTRLSLASLLLMGLGPEYPPFKWESLALAYRQTGYQGHPDGADEGALYEHALKFLDELVQHSDGRPIDRLEAQSLVWQMQYPPPPDSLDALAKELLLPPEFLREIAELLEDKRQVIFQGPPGTSKTYVARALARHLAGDEDRVQIVQFHPSYAYEDFVQGFRPRQEGDGVGFNLTNGPLIRLAHKAREEADRARDANEDPAKFFLIIDEINRGNLAKVLGELYFLLEYRDDEIHLQYSDEPFVMPPNLYIIGTMNTADRSIALVDAALRRRFYFVEFHPDEEPIKGLLKEWLKQEAAKQKWSDKMDWLPGVVERANAKMGDQRRDAAIGPSYFMKDDIPEKLELVWEHNVIPYVEEQIYDQRGRIKDEFDLKVLRDEGNAASAPSSGDGDGEQDGSAETTAGNEEN